MSAFKVNRWQEIWSKATPQGRSSLVLSLLLSAVGLFFLLIPEQINFGVLLCLWAITFAHFRFSLRHSSDKHWLPLIGGALCALFWIWGSFRSPEVLALTPLTSLIFAAGAIGFMLAASPSTNSKPSDSYPDWTLQGLIIRALLLAAVIIASRQILVHLYGEKVYDPIGVFMYFVVRYRGPYEGIPTLPFTEWPRLIVPLAWFGAFLYAIPRLAKLPTPDKLMGLCLAAFLGKFAIAYLNYGGLESLNYQITAISNHYYEIAQKIMGHEWDFICDFNRIQPLLGTHGESHPFGPPLFYDLLIRIIGPNPFGIAMAVMALSTLTILPLYGLSRESGLSDAQSFAAACLYAASPPSLILASSGIDCIIAPLMALALWAWLCQLRSPELRWSLLAGLIAAFTSFLSQIAIYLLLLFALLSIPALLKDQKNRKIWQSLAIAAGMVILVHAGVFFATDGRFHYEKVLASAAAVHGGGNGVRPYSIFVWGNGMLFLAYVGLGTAALFLGKAYEGFWNGGRESILGILGFGVLAMMILNGLGNIEIQRIYLWAYAFLFIASAPWATEAKGKFNAAVSLNFAAAVLLELLVLDFW